MRRPAANDLADRLRQLCEIPAADWYPGQFGPYASSFMSSRLIFVISCKISSIIRFCSNLSKPVPADLAGYSAVAVSRFPSLPNSNAVRVLHRGDTRSWVGCKRCSVPPWFRAARQHAASALQRAAGVVPDPGRSDELDRCATAILSSRVALRHYLRLAVATPSCTTARSRGEGLEGKGTWSVISVFQKKTPSWLHTDGA